MAGSPVSVTGLDALRAAAAHARSGGASVLVEVLLAGVGALLVLAFVFASFMALVPLLMALVAIPTTFLLVWPLAAVTEVSVIVKFLIALIGLAVAIDYALLVVVRWREERRGAGRARTPWSPRCSTRAGRSRSAARRSRISLLALVAVPVPFLRSIGLAGLLIPLVSVAVAVTLLPVLLATIGPALDRPPPAAAGPGEPRLVGLGAHRRAPPLDRGHLSIVALGALALAATSIQLGNPRADSLARTGAARAGVDRLVRSGIGAGPLAPFDTVVRSRDAGAVAHALAGTPASAPPWLPPRGAATAAR